MKKAKTKHISKMILIIVLLNFTQSFAQLSPKTVRVAFLNEATALPSLRLLKLPIHPTFNVGTDLRVRSGKHWQRALGADAYYYYQRLDQHAIMLDASYRIGYKFNFGLQLNLLTALGYKHAILSGEKYELKDGAYQKTFHLGMSQVNTKLGFGLEYPISENYSIMTDYRVMVAAPSGGLYIPFSINTFLGAGLKINLKK
jgi:long-subunit fatty acid transport protein